MHARLRYSRAELMQSHPYVSPHDAAGYRLHGGFMEGGAYVSPRTLVRWPAVRAWGEALKARGWPLIDASLNAHNGRKHRTPPGRAKGLVGRMI